MPHRPYQHCLLAMRMAVALKERNQDNYVTMSDVLNLSFWVARCWALYCKIIKFLSERNINRLIAKGQEREKENLNPILELKWDFSCFLTG